MSWGPTGLHTFKGERENWIPLRASDPAYDAWIGRFEAGGMVTVPDNGPRISVLLAPDALSMERVAATVESLKEQLIKAGS